MAPDAPQLPDVPDVPNTPPADQASATSLIEGLGADHRLIERVVGAFQTYVRRRLDGPRREGAGEACALDATRFMRFFRGFVGGCHHDREEQVLVPLLVERLGVPEDRGPIAALLAQHHLLAAALTELEPLLAACTERSKIETLTRRYTHGLWSHIDAEDSVWFPESEARLRKAGPTALPEAALRPEEAALREDGERLIAAYPPVFDPSAMRGQGCVVCPSYGVDCAGIEREWWNQSEWDELDDHLGDHMG